MRPKRVALMIAMVGVAILAIWGTLRAMEDRRCRSLLEEARREIDGERYGTARARLTEILKRRPGWDEARYHLGVCELARQRVQAAWDAFEGVSADSPWAGWSDVRRSRIAMDRGRYAECEDLLVRAAARAGPHVAEARWGLVLLLRMEGRFDEARRCLQAGFDQMSSPVTTLQRLYKLDFDSFPIEGIRWGLDRAVKQAPDDDRVWLARAHLAIRTGDFAEAEGWLGRCLARRPEDPAVWRMKLEWALAANRPDEVRRTLPHLPADEEPAGPCLGPPGLAGRTTARPRCRATRLERTRRARPGRRAGAGTSGRARARSRPDSRGRCAAAIDPRDRPDTQGIHPVAGLDVSRVARQRTGPARRPARPTVRRRQVGVPGRHGASWPRPVADASRPGRRPGFQTSSDPGRPPRGPRSGRHR